MDDSDQDFVDLCSKLLKRVRKKPNESKQAKKAEHQHTSQTSDGDKCRRTNKRNGDLGSKCAGTQPVNNGAGADPHVVCAGQDSGDAGASVVPGTTAAKPRDERSLTPKDKVLLRMQQFKRVDPRKIVHKSQTTKHEDVCEMPVLPAPSQDAPETLSSGLHPVPQDSDEALALRLQQELDNEAAEAQTVDLEEGGLFFCQICHRDLSRMTPEGRTQHLNRCLDESEQSTQAHPPPPPLPPPPPGVPDCPICGKKFKSQKSRSTHLKRCSTDLGVPPALLMQAVQRQAEETQNAPTSNTLSQTGGTKRKGPSKPSMPAKKKSRKKTEPLDEDTMIAMALSSSLQEQEKEQQRERESERQLQTETAASHTSVALGLKWRLNTGAGKGRGKKKKGVTPHPPSLLLTQDANTALTKLQERVSALLLRARPPSPPTPTLCPSTLPGWSGAAPLWQKSALLDEGSTSRSDFYTPELKEFITPWEPVVLTDAASSSTTNKPETSVRREGTPLSASRASVLRSQKASPSPAPSTPGTGQLPVCSQALRDLMELAEDGMTLTQCGYTVSGTNKAHSAGQITNLRLSGFVLEESEEQADLCVSGFLPEATHALSKDVHSRAKRTTDQPGADRERSVALSRLASDLSSMVNNPQLSDLQLQVDSGEVFFAHSFIVYARCPLLAEMVHESGFGVQEEGMPAAQRVLINDVPGQAVIVLLRYLYTAHCSIPASVRPQLMELASRFDLQELQQLCELHGNDAETQEDEEDYMNQEGNVNKQTDQTLVELLRSMWNEEDDEEGEGADTDKEEEEKRGLEEDQTGDLTAADIEIHEEKVNEDELEEIYEFAATQRKRDEEDSLEEEEEEEVDEAEKGEKVVSKLSAPRRSSEEESIKSLQQNSQIKPDLSLDRSYSRLFSDSWGVYEEADPSPLASTSCPGKTSTSGLQLHQTPHKSNSSMSCKTLLLSSQENSRSPLPKSTNLPVPGWSPGLAGRMVTDKAELLKGSPPLKRESQGPKSICVPLSPQLGQKKKEPELIVLSDSSDELEELPSSHSPSPCSPPENQNLQSSHTHIKPQPVLKANESTLERKKSSSLDQSPRDSSSAQCSEGCSPEVSWLIPSTPVQRERSTTSSSTQTRSSMCRTQLFPRRNASSSSVFSSPALPTNNRLNVSDSPAGVSAHAGPLEGSSVKIKQETDLFSSSLDFEFGPEGVSGCNVNTDREVFAAPRSQTKGSHPSVSMSLKQDGSLQPHLPPYSSTPLHTELHLKATSQKSESSPSESLEKTELGSFHLSPPSSSSCRDPQNSHKQNESFRQSRRSVELSRNSCTEPELTSREIRNEERGDVNFRNKDRSDEGEKKDAETKEADFSFQQSFMDEPPIAFNDSWGLDPCMEPNPGCFSLRLEDSRGSDRQPSPAGLSVQSSEGCSGVGKFSPLKPYPQDHSLPEINSLLDSKIWDSWNGGEEEEEEEALPLSQRLNPPALHKTPAAASRNKRRHTLVPITPMPHYSDMDTPDLKNKLNRFGVRPLPKRQMILKLKEIHQYTHQLVSSDSDSETPAQVKPPPSSSVRFKEPRAPTNASPLKHNREEQAELLSASQGSNTSSTAEESERSNPELCVSSDGDSDSDGGISASQVASRLQDRLQAVRSFILSDSTLYTQILQYQPLVLSQLQERLKAAGIRLGAAKLVDYLDSQCITFTTAKPGHPAPSRRRGRKTKAAGDGGARRKKVATALL